MSTCAVIGTGYVGLTTGACLASLGHRAVCSDVDAAKIARLSRGSVDIGEPGLPGLVADGLATGRLEFTASSPAAVEGADFAFLCVPTPMGPGGAADLGALESVLAEIGPVLPHGCVLVCKSTVPVGTCARVAELVGRPDVAVVSNPEFLREGSAVRDFLNPDRIVVGADSPRAADRVAALYALPDTPVVRTGPAAAELVKYAANCFLATKLSFANSLAELCERLGADIADVAEGMGHDRRIGHSFLRPGPGWGGSCLPKDTAALLRTAADADFDFEVLDAAVRANERQRARIADKVAECCGPLEGARLGLLGLTFKAGTDDLRDSPALAVAAELAARGAELLACDPGVRDGSTLDGPVRDGPVLDGPDLDGAVRDGPVLDGSVPVALVDDPYEVAKGADGLVLLTEWPQFRDLDWPRVAGLLAGRVVVDTRNHLDPRELRAAGIAWHGTGKPRFAGHGPVEFRGRDGRSEQEAIMAEDVQVLQLGEHEFAAEVHEGDQTTEHRVSYPAEVLDALDMPEPDEQRFVAESLKYLLQRTPSTALPHDIDLEGVQNEDLDFLPEMRARMSG